MNINRVLAQHNALVNGRFAFIPLQMKLFVALLARVDYQEPEAREVFIPTAELIGTTHSVGGSTYEALDEMCKGITSFKLYVEELEAGTRRRSKKPKFTYLPLMALASYDGMARGVTAKFNPDIMPYLTQLHECGNFTMADLQEVVKLTSPYALRIYWLLKEYADFGKRTLELEQLRFMLQIEEDEYEKMNHFKTRVLEKAQQEIAKTDIPFTYELLREGRAVKRIKFMFPSTTELASTAPVSADWAVALTSLGVSRRTVLLVAEKLEQRTYDLGYVGYVVKRVEDGVRLKKIKQRAGAIHSALLSPYWLGDYQKSRQAQLSLTRPAPTAAPGPREVNAVSLADVQAHYEKRHRLPAFLRQNVPADETLAEYVARLYGEHVRENRDGESWLVRYA